MVGVVGLRTWNGTYVARVQGHVPRGAGRVGLYLGGGILFGAYLSLPNAFSLHTFYGGNPLSLTLDVLA